MTGKPSVQFTVAWKYGERPGAPRPPRNASEQ